VKSPGFGFNAAVLGSIFFLLGVNHKVFGDTEIDLSDDLKPTPTLAPSKPFPTATALPKLKMEPTPTLVPKINGGPSPIPTTSLIVMNPTATEEVEETPTPMEVHGVLKMKDIYGAGIKAYQELDYDQAIRYLKKAITTQDPYSEKFYYAEANAMLGVIYQFHIIHYGWAYQYYREALKYEKNNPTAKRHIKQVYQYRNDKD